VLIGGYFTSVDGVTRNRIAQLNANGSLDTSFDPGDGADSWVGAVAVQSNGEIIIGGDFTAVDGTARNHIARLHADGSLDFYFDTSSGADGTVYDAAIQPDGKVVIGGEFTSVDGVAHVHIARLNGATSPVITSNAPSSMAEVGVAYSHTFYAKGYPFAPTFSVTDGDLPSGLSLEATSGQFSGIPATAGAYNFTVSACNYVPPCDTQNGNLIVAKGDTTTTIRAHKPNPSAVGQTVTVGYSVSSGVGAPTGNVTVTDGTVSCTGKVTDGTCSLTFTTVGTKTLTADYSGDMNFNPSTSPAVAHTVNDEPRYLIYLPALLKQ
jgi:hypothetical protein